MATKNINASGQQSRKDKAKHRKKVAKAVKRQVANSYSSTSWIRS